MDRSRKKGDDPKAEDKDNNTASSTGAHIGDATAAEEFTGPSGGDSIGAHVLEVNKMSSCPSRTVEEILGAHSMGNDEFWVGLIQVMCLLTQQTAKKLWWVVTSLNNTHSSFDDLFNLSY